MQKTGNEDMNLTRDLRKSVGWHSHLARGRPALNSWAYFFLAPLPWRVRSARRMQETATAEPMWSGGQYSRLSRGIRWPAVSLLLLPLLLSWHRLDAPIRTKCISRESNPGHIDGNDVFYH